MPGSLDLFFPLFFIICPLAPTLLLQFPGQPTSEQQQSPLTQGPLTHSGGVTMTKGGSTASSSGLRLPGKFQSPLMERVGIGSSNGFYKRF